MPDFPFLDQTIRQSRFRRDFLLVSPLNDSTPPDFSRAPVALALLYVATVLLTEVLTNNAAAVLMFPVAMAFGEQLGVSFLPFVLAVMFAASASFITPLGYQTNLMVMGPGRYRYADFARLGLPLSLVVGVVAVGLIPFVWGF